MSELRYQNPGNQPIAGRVTDRIRNQFPKWAAASEVANTTTSSKSEHSEFLLLSNWVLLPGGLQEFTNELKEKVEGIDLTYDLETASLKIKCLATQEEAVMAVCQSTMDKIVRDELDDDWAAAKKTTAAKGWHATEQHQKESVMALAPEDIQRSTYRTAWVMPEDLIKRDVLATELLPSDFLAELQLLASCKIIPGNDGFIVYIGAESEGHIAVAERKLNTLAKYAAMPSEADTLCESFVYTEDEQDGLATFTYVAFGLKTILTTFFLDRAKYQLGKGSSAYGKIFEKGVSVALLTGGLLHPTVVAVDIAPAISSNERNSCFKAFSPSWSYRPKHKSDGLGSANDIPSSSFSQHNTSQRVTSWITRLPSPELMSPLRDRNKAPGFNLVDAAQEQVRENQGNSLEKRNYQTPSTSAWQELEKAGPCLAQESLSGRQEPTPSQSSQSTFQDRTGSNTRKKQGNGKRSDRYEPQRNPGKGNPRPHGRQPRGGQLNTNSYRGSRQAGPMTPRIQRTNLQNQTAHLGNADNLSNHEYPTGYIPPHLRHLHTPGEANTAAESSDDAPNASEISPTDLDSSEPGHRQRFEELRDLIGGLTRETKMLQPQAQRPEPIRPTSTLDDPFVSAWNKPQPQHDTMRQQAPLPLSRKRVKGQDLMPSDGTLNQSSDYAFMQAMSQKLVRMMSSLEVFKGRVTLKAELGRLCLTKINPNYVYTQGSISRGQIQSLHDMKEALDKHHVNPRDVMFTNILTAEGADANYIAFMQDGLGERMWLPNTRRTVYELTCCAHTKKNKLHRFVVEIDGGDFTYQVRPHQSNPCSLFVHCPRRAWDFQVTFSKTPNLDAIYSDFARDLVDSMRVIPQDSGIPLLEFTVKKAYKVEMLLLRTRNIATYKSQTSAPSSPSSSGAENTSPSNILEICEVHDMTPLDLIERKDKVTAPFQQHPGIQQLGQLPTWYEVSIQSELVNKALQQNRDLEYGEEVHWSPEQLQAAGAFDELIRSATHMVKRIDGVGYWGDNYQDAMIHAMPSTVSTTTSQYSTARSTKKEPW
ncbi:hypothetical protein F5Y13DRAFT_204364 [Hypoxylon sp. FL1857]|nr:hypothetical protein F5Y13DRAFT_204364 [Hypoxylon sp. FL1857]